MGYSARSRYFSRNWLIGMLARSTRTCFRRCSTEPPGVPDPVAGLLWMIVTAVLLAIPVAVGTTIAAVRSWAAWATTALTVALAVTAEARPKPAP